MRGLRVPMRARRRGILGGRRRRLSRWPIGRGAAAGFGLRDRGCGAVFRGAGPDGDGHRFLGGAIRRARAKAAERGLAVDFRVGDALALGEVAERFASVIDSGLFHVFSDDDRRRYVRGSGARARTRRAVVPDVLQRRGAGDGGAAAGVAAGAASMRLPTAGRSSRCGRSGLRSIRNSRR